MSVAGAALDVLAITSRLQNDAGGAMEGEIHSFAYLGCLVSFYDRNDPAWWRYRFTATSGGAPYAHALSDALEALGAAGAVLPGSRGLVLSELGQAQLELLRRSSLGERDHYLEAATATALMMPLPVVPEAITLEPQLKRALRWSVTSELLEPDGLDLIRKQFAAVTEDLAQEQVDAREDLMVPAVLWLTYLLDERQSKKK